MVVGWGGGAVVYRGVQGRAGAWRGVQGMQGCAGVGVVEVEVEVGDGVVYCAPMDQDRKGG